MSIELFCPTGIGEITPSTDLVAVLADCSLADGDIIVVTSKAISKAEGRVVELDKDSAIAQETRRIVARRGATLIVENQLGLVMAAAGVDTSNVTPGKLVLLPKNPDASARFLRTQLRALHDVNVAVLISDTSGRAWRHGQIDIAVGAAGIEPLHSFAGKHDPYGNELAVTAPAVADELTSAAELASGKLGQRPVTIIRGLSQLVLPAGAPGPGAQALNRDVAEDMFRLGSREAVLAAVTATDLGAFGTPAAASDLLNALSQLHLAAAATPGAEHIIINGPLNEPQQFQLEMLLRAFAWQVAPASSLQEAVVELVPRHPAQ